jgi:hypothetical protein
MSQEDKMHPGWREDEKQKGKEGSSSSNKISKVLKSGGKRFLGMSSHSSKSSGGENVSVRDSQSPTTSAPSPNPSAARQPQGNETTVLTPYLMQKQGPPASPGNQVALFSRKVPSNAMGFPNASQPHPRSIQDVTFSSTSRPNIGGMENPHSPPQMDPRNDSHQGIRSSPERLRTNGPESGIKNLPDLPYPETGEQFTFSTESALHSGRQLSRPRAGSGGMNGVGNTSAALTAPFTSPMDIPLRRADTLDNFTPKGTTPSATWPHPPIDYTQVQIQDLQSRLQRAEADRVYAQDEAENAKSHFSNAVREARGQTEVANNRISELEESLRVETLQASSKADEFSRAIQQIETALAEAERNVVATQKSMAQVYEDLEKSQEECRQLQEAEKEQLDTITRLNGGFGQHLSNDHFQKLLKDLRTDIQIWAEDFFKGTIEEKRLSPNAFLANVSDECNEYLRSPMMRPKLVQAYVWSVLNSSVFASNERNNPGLWWAHTRQAQLSGLRAFLQPTGKSSHLHYLFSN